MNWYAHQDERGPLGNHKAETRHNSKWVFNGRCIITEKAPRERKSTWLSFCRCLVPPAKNGRRRKLSYYDNTHHDRSIIIIIIIIISEQHQQQHHHQQNKKKNIMILLIMYSYVREYRATTTYIHRLFIASRRFLTSALSD